MSKINDPEQRRSDATSDLLSKKFGDTVTPIVQKRKPGRPPRNPKGETQPEVFQEKPDRLELLDEATKNYDYEKELFVRGLLAVIQSYQAKTPEQVRKCIPAADEVVAIVKQKYE